MKPVFKAIQGPDSPSLAFEVLEWRNGASDLSSEVLSGWVVSRTGLPYTIIFSQEGRIVSSAPVSVVRPDVLASFPHVAPDTPSGFLVALPSLTLNPRLGLDIDIVELRASESITVPVGILTLPENKKRVSAYRESHRPLLVVSLGRSGSTLLMSELAKHRHIYAGSNYPFEERLPVYLWHAAKIMTSPWRADASSQDEIEVRMNDEIGINPFRSFDWESSAESYSMNVWLRHDHVRDCIDFSKRQVDDYVVRANPSIKYMSNTFVAQKMLPSDARNFVHNIYHDSKEVILVRDFRDMWLSARSFNKKRKKTGFSRQEGDQEELWMRRLQAGSRQIRMVSESAGKNAIVIKYEDLIIERQKTLDKISLFLGLPNFKDAMSFIGNEKDKPTEQHITSSASLKGEPRWRSEMTNIEKQLSWDIFGDDLTYFGYSEK